METESALQAAAASSGDLKGGKRVKLRLQIDDVIARVGPPYSIRYGGIGSLCKVEGESTVKDEIGMTEETDVMIVIDSDGEENSSNIAKNKSETAGRFSLTRC